MPTYRFPHAALKIGLFLVVIIFLASCSFFGERKKGQYIPIDFDLKQDVGTFSGLGANVPISFYSRRMKVLQTFNDLGIKYIRVKRESDNWDDILALRASTSRLGIKWIYSLDAIPIDFVNEYGQLIDVKGFAGWWAEEVDELLYQDVPADFIELLNFPLVAPGDSLPFTPEIYNELIHATRLELDLREFNEVLITGPGLPNPGVDGDNELWYMGLDQEAFETLDHWSVQMWENQIEDGELRPAIEQLIQYLEEIESRKAIFVNSYATSHSQFGDSQYPDPNQYDVLGNLDSYETYYYSASFSLPYALRVYSNTLDLLRPGQVVPIIYQLYDAPADVKYKKKSWGLLDLNGVAKPIFTLLSNLMKRIPDRAVVVPPTQDLAENLNAIVFNNREQVLVTVSNEDTQSKSIQVRFKGAGRVLEFSSAVTCQSHELNAVALGKRDEIETLETEYKLRFDSESKSYSFTVAMEPQSTLIAEFQYK